ncbi:MAG: hypothetical protein ABSF10_19825 [Verrucomicrobiota bacterium]
MSVSKPRHGDRLIQKSRRASGNSEGDLTAIKACLFTSKLGTTLAQFRHGEPKENFQRRNAKTHPHTPQLSQNQAKRKAVCRMDGGTESRRKSLGGSEVRPTFSPSALNVACTTPELKMPSALPMRWKRETKLDG